MLFMFFYVIFLQVYTDRGFDTCALREQVEPNHSSKLPTYSFSFDFVTSLYCMW